MMKKILFYLSCLLFVFPHTTAFAQEKEIVLVNGNPPLTQLMVGKTIVLLDWMLDLKLTQEQELQIKEILVKSWKEISRCLT
jgi:hypothetical protein